MHLARVLGCRLAAAALGSLVLFGCTDKATPVNSANAHAEHGHSHERDKMLIADAGRYHVLLTAHLSKDGNELDIFFETQSGEDPKPVAVELESFTAQATFSDGEVKELKFEPAPLEERPEGEEPGKCSHFVAEAGWMKPDDKLDVAATLKLRGKEVRARWHDFVPKKYAHHVDE